MNMQDHDKNLKQNRAGKTPEKDVATISRKLMVSFLSGQILGGK